MNLFFFLISKGLKDLKLKSLGQDHCSPACLVSVFYHLSSWLSFGVAQLARAHCCLETSSFSGLCFPWIREGNAKQMGSILTSNGTPVFIFY